jgi:hypothetical protein
MVSSMTYLNLKNTGTHDGGIVMLIAKIRKKTTMGYMSNF